MNLRSHHRRTDSDKVDGARLSDLPTNASHSATNVLALDCEIVDRTLQMAEDFVTVQKEVADILKYRLLVGHALNHDFQVLSLRHPQKDIRDTQNYGPFLKSDGRSSALKHLADLHLGAKIQQGEHDSVEDARAALRLYLLFQDAWEKSLNNRQKGLTSARRPYHSKKASRVG